MLLIKDGSFDATHGLHVVCELSVHLWLVLGRELDAAPFLVDEDDDVLRVGSCLLECLDGLRALGTNLGGRGLVRLLVEAEELILVTLRIVRAFRHLDDSSLETESNEVFGGGIICEFLS